MITRRIGQRAALTVAGVVARRPPPRARSSTGPAGITARRRGGRQGGRARPRPRSCSTGYAETLRKGAPLAARFVDELSPEEVTAAIRMVDELPRLREHLVEDVMPLLGKLDQVGPDLHKLLEVTEDLRLAIAGLPGLKMLRRRGEERVEEESFNGR